MVAAAGELFRRQGYHGTGLNQILAESSAPRGSLYFHFPDGKQQLAIEAVTNAGSAVGEGIAHVLRSNDDVGEAVARVVDYLAADLRESDYEHGCPVGTVALDAASSSEPVRLACNEIFDQWLDHIQRGLENAGWTPGEARDQALDVLSAIEGALLVARVRRDTAPLQAVGRRLRKTLSAPTRADGRAPSRGERAGRSDQSEQRRKR